MSRVHLGAETRQACDLEGVGAEARQLTNFRIHHSYRFRKPPRLFHPFFRTIAQLGSK
ncbi:MULTISPECIES: hypothetical protein [Cytobacillus]|uniref:hypothetical protein n=1 Tax=Cytobacillus TaxID=2675230 RepID=UPI0014170C12|nr:MULTISPECIES: hypothetical protein [Cytobacillus]